jgi:hypothetical protein
MSKRSNANDMSPGDKSRSNVVSGEGSSADMQLEELMRHLYFSAKCGNAAAEHNLENAGVTEIVQGHVAGKMREGDNYWGDCRWQLSELGKRTKLTDLKDTILRDPPLEIAMLDAEDEAKDVAARTENPVVLGYVTVHKRILAHLNEIVERIRAAQT